MSRKGTAHRPSQSHQEFVITSDGRKVRNTAYNPKSNHQSTSSSASAVRSDFGQEGTDYEDNINYSEKQKRDFRRQLAEDVTSGLNSLDSVLDKLDNGENLTVDDVKNVSGLGRFMYELKTMDPGKSQQILSDYGIKDLEKTDWQAEDDYSSKLWKSSTECKRVDFNSSDPGYPNAIVSKKTKMRHNDGTSYPVEHTDISFDADSPGDISEIAYREANGENFRVEVNRLGEDDYSHSVYATGDQSIERGGRTVHQRVMNGSENSIISLSMQTYNGKGMSIGVVPAVSENKVKPGTFVDYSYQGKVGESPIVATWEEKDGTKYQSVYHVGDQSVAEPGEPKKI